MTIGQETGGPGSETADQSLRRMQHALHIAGIGTWEMDLRSNSFAWDERCRELHGYESRDISGYSEVIEVVHPEDMQLVRAAIRGAIDDKAGSRYEIRFRVLREDGSLLHWLHGKGAVERDAEGNAIRITGTTQDITALYDAQRKASDAEQFARLAIEAAGAGSYRLIVATGEFIHSPTLKRMFTGTTEGPLQREDFIRYVHPDDRAIRKRAHELALQNGQLQYEIRVIWEDGTIRWMRATGTYEYDVSGAPTALSGIMEDITEFKKSQLAIEKSERLARTVFEDSPVAKIITTGKDLKIEALNKRMQEILGAAPGQLIGASLPDAIPAFRNTRLPDLLLEVQQSGNLIEVAEEGFENLDSRSPGRRYFEHRHSPLRSESGDIQGVISTWIDVSREVALRLAEQGHQQALQASEARFRALIDEAPVATCLFVGPEMRIELANEMMLKAWGKGSSILGKPLAEAIPEIVGQPFLQILDDVYRTGIPYNAEADELQLIVNGELRTFFYNFTYKPVLNDKGEVYGIMDMAIDVTEAVLARRRLEDAQSALMNAIDLAELGTWSLDIESGRVLISARMLDWFGLTQEEVLLGEAVNAIAASDRDRVLASIAEASKPGAGIYSEEYTVVNRRTRQQRLIHAQGKAIRNAAGASLRLEGTARDITLQREVQTALELLVQQRTEELAAANEELQATNEELLVTNEELAEANERLVHSNEELAQYAYVASHDLQEPLRKIRVFSGMLERSEQMNGDDRNLLSKIGGSAERMSMLIRDLLEFSRLLNSESAMHFVNLHDVATAVCSDFELRIIEQEAQVYIGNLPLVEGVGLQMNQLFYNLIGNALKFVRPGIAPVIRVDAAPISTTEAARYVGRLLRGASYFRISVSDNGIGFEQQYTEQIFEVFKRLHGRDVYPGSGIGLALCRRIADNHLGALYAESSPGRGSVFHLILPSRQGQAFAPPPVR